MLDDGVGELCHVSAGRDRPALQDGEAVTEFFAKVEILFHQQDTNAPLVAKARGLRVVETSTPESEDFASLLGATLATDRGEWSVAGALFKGREPRLVRIDGYPLEAIPHGWMLVFSNLDVPGVVGRIGTLCGRHDINIAGMQLGRERRGGRAVSILNLDDPMPEAVLAEIRAMPDIVLAKLVKL